MLLDDPPSGVHPVAAVDRHVGLASWQAASHARLLDQRSRGRSTTMPAHIAMVATSQPLLSLVFPWVSSELHADPLQLISHIRPAGRMDFWRL